MIQALLGRIPVPVRTLLVRVFSLLAGFAVALLFDYVLYRAGLPGKPFIYVSF
jgi:hypothetical protein